MPPTSTTPDSIDSPSSDPPEVTAENAAEILAADDETETRPPAAYRVVDFLSAAQPPRPPSSPAAPG